MQPQDLSMEVLTDIQKDKVIAFCADPMMFEAVKTYVLAVVYKHGVIKRGMTHNPGINWAMNLSWPAADGKIRCTDEELGQGLRAMTMAGPLT